MNWSKTHKILYYYSKQKWIRRIQFGYMDTDFINNVVTMVMYGPKNRVAKKLNQHELSNHSWSKI